MTAGDRVIELLQLARLEQEHADAVRGGNVRLADGLANLIEHRRRHLAEDGHDADG